MADRLQSVLADPEFKQLPGAEQMKVLGTLDPEFAALPAAEQAKAHQAMTGTGPGLIRQGLSATTTATGRVLAGLGETVAAPFLAAADVTGLAPGINSPEARAAGQRAGEATGREVAKFIVPQNEVQLGMLAGSMLVPPLAAARYAPAVARGLSAASPALAKVFGGAAGGAAGAGVAGESPVSGAIEGGATLAGTQLLGKVLGVATLRGPGGKGAQSARDAIDYAQEMGRQSPALAGARTVRDLHALAEGPGRAALGSAKERVVVGIEDRIGNAQFAMPSLGNQTVQAANPAAAGALHGQVPFAAPGPRMMTLREANDELSRIGAKAFSRLPADRNFNGIDQRRLYGQVEREIEQGLTAIDPTGVATNAFRLGQQEYKKGLALLAPLESPRSYRVAGTNEQFAMDYVQAILNNPKRANALRNKLGAEDFEAFRQMATRGAGHGVDRLAFGTGTPTDAARMLMDMKGGTGALVGATPKVLFPNLRTQYATSQWVPSLPIPPALQAILDAAGIQGVGGLR